MIGTIIGTIIAIHRPPTPKARPLVLAACCAVVVGSATQGSVVFRIGTTLRRTIGTTITASALCLLFKFMFWRISNLQPKLKL